MKPRNIVLVVIVMALVLWAILFGVFGNPQLQPIRPTHEAVEYNQEELVELFSIVSHLWDAIEGNDPEAITDLMDEPGNTRCQQDSQLLESGYEIQASSTGRFAPIDAASTQDPLSPDTRIASLEVSSKIRTQGKPWQDAKGVVNFVNRGLGWKITDFSIRLDDSRILYSCAKESI